MARMNVGTPRFYIDTGLYQQACGKWTPSEEHLPFVQLNPTNVQDTPSMIKVPRLTPIKYMAVLGHDGGTIYPEWITGDADDPDTPTDEAKQSVAGLSAEVNGQSLSIDDSVMHSGFSVYTFDDDEEMDKLRVVLFGTSELGAASVGNYYDMPHSPDLSLKLSYEYDGVKTVQTKGGSTLSNASYTKPADWGSRGAWQLGDNPSYRGGRRVWDLSFSYISDSDLMPLVAASTNLGAGISEDIQNPTDNTLLEGTDFFSVVWNQTMGGHLQFIFQPDNNNNNPDNFAIARFDMNTLTYNQVANNVYNIKLKIREVW